MKRWGALLLVAVAGCTTGITAPMDMAAPAANDLPAATSDMTQGCTLAFSGDVPMTVACRIFLCRPPDASGDQLDLAGPFPDNPTNAHAIFGVSGMLAVGSYARADLKIVDVGIMSGGKDYRAQATNGTAAVTISGVQAPNATDPCSGVAHGTATATLVELDTIDGGTQVVGPGRVMLNATF